MKKSLFILSAVLSCSVMSFDAQANEGVSRQVKALKTALDSFAETMRTRMDAVEDNVAAFNTCADLGMVFAPNRAPAGSETGCASVSSSGVIEIIPEGRIVDTGEDHMVHISLAGRHGFRGELPLDVFRLEDVDSVSSVIIKTNVQTFTNNWESGRDGNEDHHTASASIGSYIRIGNEWISVGTGTTVSLDRNTNLTSVGGEIYSGLWAGEVANVRGCNETSGSRLGVWSSCGIHGYSRLEPSKPQITKTH